VTCVSPRKAMTNSDGKRQLVEQQYIVRFDDDAIGERTMFEGQLEIRQQMFVEMVIDGRHVCKAIWL